MRRPLIHALGAALVCLVLIASRRALGADERPVVRVVLATNGEAPPWFDGFVKHLERELALRGIDVAVARGERAAKPRDAAGSAAVAGPDAELVVEVPAPLRPVLRFAAPSRGERGGTESATAGRVRQLNLAGVPADGWALALAAAADELMRSNWPRAVPVEGASSVPPESPSREAEEAKNSAAPPNSGKANADARRANKAPISETSSSAQTRLDREDRDDAATEQGASSPFSNMHSRIALAAAGEAFTGGQTQLGGDVRWEVQVLPRLDLEICGGWRHILRQETTNGAIDGNALVAGGSLGLVALQGTKANLSLVARAYFLRVAYSGDPRDGTVDASDGSALGLVLAAGPRARLSLSHSFGLQAELLAGTSPLATSATDDGRAVFATNGAAFLGSLGLSLGL